MLMKFSFNATPQMENLAQNELLQALAVEEDFWREKARVNWQVGGDRNTRFFHKVTKIRQATKVLSTLREGDQILTTQAEIAHHALSGPCGLRTPSHVLYADDIFIFCKGLKTNLLALKSLILEYAQASGQHVNLAKCKFYTGCASVRRVSNLSAILGFSANSLPFTYLGVPLFKGKPRRLHLQPIADRIIAKLATWKVGGLGLRSIKLMNQAALLKLSWEMLSSDQDWALFCRQRFGRDTAPSPRYYKSSIWHGIKVNWDMVMSNSLWLVGDGSRVRFWKDKWIGSALVDRLNIPTELHASLVATVADYVSQSIWTIPRVLAETFPTVVEEIVNLNISNAKDKLIWTGTTDGALSFKAAFLCLKPEDAEIHWCKKIWSASIPPSKSFTTWRLFHKRLPTDDNLQLRGCLLASKCSLCNMNAENSSHLFLTCPLAVQLWGWLGSIFQINLDTSTIDSIFSACNGQWSPQVKGVLIAAIIHTINTIWFCRNHRRFEDRNVTFLQAKARIKEGNIYADKLASFGVSSKIYTWWDVTPSFICEEVNRNRLNRFKSTYSSLYMLYLTKIMTVQQAGTQVNNVWTWNRNWRRNLHIWEEPSLLELQEILLDVHLDCTMLDSWSWTPCSVEFSVNSAYMCLFSNLFNNNKDEVPFVFKDLWKIKALRKVVAFSWQFL
ncbi:hypothetical protein Lal_00012013 [Lupinus albus]|nr:hypothetical protein Lal_00012013 [Lupinus albus]